MFDEVTALRLERLEREDSRRKWGSAIQTASQRGHLELPDGDGPTPIATSVEMPLVDLLDERLDRLERKQQRLEWQITRQEARLDFWRRTSAAALLSTIVVSSGLGALAILPRVSSPVPNDLMMNRIPSFSKSIPIWIWPSP